VTQLPAGEGSVKAEGAARQQSPSPLSQASGTPALGEKPGLERQFEECEACDQEEQRIFRPFRTEGAPAGCPTLLIPKPSRSAAALKKGSASLPAKRRKRRALVNVSGISGETSATQPITAVSRVSLATSRNSLPLGVGPKQKKRAVGRKRSLQEACASYTEGSAFQEWSPS